VVGLFGIVIERTMLQWLAGLDHLYGLLLTFGLALIIQGVFQNYFGSSGLPYDIPDLLKGGTNLGFMFCRTIAPGSSCSRSSSAWRHGS
jgi:branched-chain amino acid transport system permease protein